MGVAHTAKAVDVPHVREHRHKDLAHIMSHLQSVRRTGVERFNLNAVDADTLMGVKTKLVDVNGGDWAQLYDA